MDNGATRQEADKDKEFEMTESKSEDGTVETSEGELKEEVDLAEYMELKLPNEDVPLPYEDVLLPSEDFSTKDTRRKVNKRRMQKKRFN